MEGSRKQFRKRARSEDSDDAASRPDAVALQALSLAQRDRSRAPGVSAVLLGAARSCAVDSGRLVAGGGGGGGGGAGGGTSSLKGGIYDSFAAVGQGAAEKGGLEAVIASRREEFIESRLCALRGGEGEGGSGDGDGGGGGGGDAGGGGGGGNGGGGGGGARRPARMDPWAVAAAGGAALGADGGGVRPSDVLSAPHRLYEVPAALRVVAPSGDGGGLRAAGASAAERGAGAGGMILAGSGMVELVLPASERAATAVATAAARDAMLARRAVAAAAHREGTATTVASSFNANYNKHSNNTYATATATATTNATTAKAHSSSSSLPIPNPNPNPDTTTTSVAPVTTGAGARVNLRKTVANDDAAFRRFKKSLY